MRYSTTKVLKREEKLLNTIHNLHNREGLQVSDSEIEKYLQKNASLAGEQVKAVRHLLQSSSAIRILEGYSGVGKTYALKACVDMWQRNGNRVLGAAYTGQAAEVLAEETGIPCATLTKLLGDYKIPVREQAKHHARQLTNAAKKRKTHRFKQPRPVETHPSVPSFWWMKPAWSIRDKCRCLRNLSSGREERFV